MCFRARKTNSTKRSVLAFEIEVLDLHLSIRISQCGIYFVFDIRHILDIIRQCIQADRDMEPFLWHIKRLERLHIDIVLQFTIVLDGKIGPF